MARLMGIAVIALAASASAIAQQVASAKAGLIQYIQGKALLDGRPLRLGAKGFLQMESRQGVRTEQGRLELLLSPETYLRLGENASLLMENNLLTDIRLALDRGSALIEVVQTLKGNPIRVRLAEGVVEIQKAGLVRLDTDSGQVRVYGGTAQVARGEQKITVKSGKSVRLENSWLRASDFDPKESDPLHQWAAQRSLLVLGVNQGARSQMQWMPQNSGWVTSSNYHVRIFSPRIFAELIRDQQQMNAISNMAASAAAAQRAQAEEEARRARLAAEEAERLARQKGLR